MRRVVHDRPAAKWLPSRHHFALARLVAFAMLRRCEPGPTKLILFVDRHQSAIETYVVTVWFLATTTCFFAAIVPPAAAFPLALIALQIPVYATGLVFNRPRLNSAFLMLCGAAAALHFAGRPTWVRYAAWAFLGVVGLNAIAFVVMWLLRRRVRAAEERCAE